MGLSGESRLADLTGNYGKFGVAGSGALARRFHADQNPGVDARMNQQTLGDDMFSGGVAVMDPAGQDLMGGEPMIGGGGERPQFDPTAPSADGQASEDDMTQQADALITGLSQVLKFNTNNACSLAETFNRRWWIYQVMNQARPPYDDPNDPLVRMGYYIPKLAKICETLAAIIVNTLVPDPSTMDWLSLRAKPLWEGIDQLSDALTAQLRDKFLMMRPECSENFLSVMNLMVLDLLKNGNMVGMVTHDILSDIDDSMNADDLIMGPCVQKLDLYNVKPWRTDVEDISKTPVSVFDPMTPDQAHMMGFENAAEFFDHESPEDCPNRYLEWASASFYNFDMMNQWSMQQIRQYKRWIYFGPFPYYLLREQQGMGAQDEKDLDFSGKFMEYMTILASRFGFDPATCTPTTTFEIHFGDNGTIARCRPYSLKLPLGMGPLLHHKLYPVSGQLWGEGIYDREQWNERSYNNFQRQVMHIINMTAKGVFSVEMDRIDASWLQLRGNQLRFQPGDVVPLRDTGTPNVQPFFQKVEMNEGAIPMVREMMASLMADMQQDTGVYDDLQGQSTAKTATQANLNNQNGMTLVDWFIKLFENNPLKSMAQRVYVVMMQAHQELSLPANVTMSAEQQALKMVQIQPDDYISLNMIDVIMTGRSSPSNRQNRFEGALEVSKLMMPTGWQDIDKTGRMLYGLLQIPPDQLALKPDMGKLQAVMQNLQSVAGDDWIHWLNPNVQQMMGMVMGKGPSMAGAPGGPPGSPQPPSGMPAGTGAGDGGVKIPTPTGKGPPRGGKSNVQPMPGALGGAAQPQQPMGMAA